MKKKLTQRVLPALATLTAAAAICATHTARADDTPPANSVRAGMYAIFYHVKADDVSATSETRIPEVTRKSELLGSDESSEDPALVKTERNL